MTSRPPAEATGHVPGPRRPGDPPAARADAQHPAPAVGRTIAGFDVLSELGRGSQSTVFQVRRTGSASDSPHYALKLLAAASDTHGQELVPLRREAALLASIDDPDLPVIHEIGEADGQPYLVMDLLAGVPLADLLVQGPMPADQVVRLALDIAPTLAAVHRRGLVHRDIKPHNVMMLPSGRARLIDFGLATRGSGGPAEAAVGTLLYAPPEQSGLLQRPVDHRSDLYSLGVVMFECLTGAPPFSSADVGELLRMHAAVAPPTLTGLVPDISPGLAAAVATLLAKDPDDRYQSGDDLAADLASLTDLTDLTDDADPADQTGTSTSQRPGRATGQAAREPLSGREREYSALAAQWQHTLQGTGCACLIRGTGGGGKSRLAAELAETARADGVLVLHGKASTDDPIPLAPLRAALDDHLERIGRLPHTERVAAQDQLRAVASPAAGLLATLTPDLGALLGTPGQDHSGQDQFTLAVSELFTSLARAAGGLLLVLDDVHWLDPGTARVLGLLSGALGDVPLMVLATARDDDESLAATDAIAQALGDALCLDLTLEPMSEEGVGALVRSLLPGVDIWPALARLLTLRGHGNPFVVQEYLRAIIDSGLLQPNWGTWVLDEAALDALELPQDALGLVVKRIENLGPQVRDLLITAAAIGTEFSPHLVAAVHQLALGTVLDGLSDAASRRLIQARGASYAFLHDRIREALHDELNPTDAAQLHLRIATALAAQPAPPQGQRPDHIYALARHVISAGPIADPAFAFAACRRAGDQALEDYAPADAVTFFRAAAALPGGQDPQFLHALGSALKQDGQLSEARAPLEQALAHEQDPFRRAQTLILLADLHRSNWAIDEGVAAITQGLAELGARLPRTKLGLVLSTLAMFAAAQFMQLFRGRVTWARGRQAERCTLIAGLHEVGSYLGVLAIRPELVILHNLRVVYWVNRIGRGPQYARSQGTFGFLCGQVGLLRSSQRAFARVAADPASQQPTVRALIGHYEGAALCLGYHDDGQRWSQVTGQEGQWLEHAAFADAVSTLLMLAVGHGRTAQAQHLLAAGERRSALRAGEVTSMIFNESLAHALCGRPGEAAAAQARAEARIQGNSALGMRALRVVTRLIVLHEQNEAGTAFDEAAAEFAQLRLHPAAMIRPHRMALFALAMGRIAQLRSADPTTRPARAAAARAAVKQLRIARKSTDLRTQEQVARASLLVAQDRPKRALAVLKDIRPAGQPDTPLLAYEAARVQARALAALGAAPEAHRQAMLAALIAQEHRWPHRANWVRAEFGLSGDDPQGRAPGSGNPLASHSTSYPATRSGVSSSGSIASSRIPSSPVSLSTDVDRSRLQALQQVSAAATRVFDPGALARIALDETIRTLHAERAFLFLIDEAGTLQPHLGRDSDGQDIPELSGYSASLVDRVHHSGEPLVVTGTEEGAALGAQSVVLHGLRSIMAAPLTLEGRMLGVVYLDSRVAKGIFTDSDVGLLIALTNHIATSLETARAAQLEISVELARQQRDLAESLRGALEAMASTFDPQEVIDQLLASARSVISCDAWLVPVAEVQADPDLPATQARLRHARSWLTLPLRSSASDLGLLVLASDAPQARLDDQLEVASALVAQGMTAHDRATLFAQVQALAVADELTGIANRRRFFEVAARDLTAAARSSRPLCVLMVDIDHFKRVNDTYGHPTGDDVIREVSRRLAEGIRSSDLIGRYGGEEFSIVLQDAASGTRLPDRLRSRVADEPIPTRSGPLDVTVSIGLAFLEGSDDQLETLLARADAALYRAKQNGRNQVAT